LSDKLNNIISQSQNNTMSNFFIFYFKLKNWI